jgi:putative hydrolase of the HAD superfamily
VKILPDEKIKAVLFDLGETLLNFGKVNITQLFCQGARLSYDLLKSAGQPVGSFGCYCWLNLIALRCRIWFSTITGKDFDTLALLKKAGAKKGIKLDDRQWQHLAWLWYEPLSKLAQIEQDLPQTLTKLTRMQLKLGILSNTFISDSSFEKHLHQLGIHDFFTVKLYSYEFDFRKPDARIFEAAAREIGVPPENILFVGDRIDKDIVPAIKAGMAAVLKTAYTNTGKTAPKGVCRITRLSELPDLIEKFNSAGKAISNF